MLKAHEEMKVRLGAPRRESHSWEVQGGGVVRHTALCRGGGGGDHRM